MSFATLLLAACLLGEPKIEWQAPAALLVGDAYKAEIAITAPEGGAKVEAWMITAAAFEVDGVALGQRTGSPIDLPPGFTLVGAVDLTPHIKATKGFKLTHASGGGAPVDVKVLTPVAEGLDFMNETALPAAELANYQVLLRTNQGDILLELWPDVAPKHVRNYLDLAYLKFYDGLTFHRVIPGFMIQGGDPAGTGSGDGPRKIPGEFTQITIKSLGDSQSTEYKVGEVHGYDVAAKLMRLNGQLQNQGKRPVEYRAERSHLPGVLSAARTPDPNSASCQFFIMHGDGWALDGQYSAFGRTVFGQDVVDRIVNAKRDRADKPLEPQRIERAVVLKANK